MSARNRSPLWLPLLIGGSVVAAAAVVAHARRADLLALAVQQFVERPARQQSYAGLAQALEQGGDAFTAQVHTAPDGEHNREVLRHIIGIERWGQARLEALSDGREAPDGGYRPYRPADSLDLPQLGAAFTDTRERTAALARQLGLHPPGDDQKVRHDSLGPLSGRGWLRYLALHATREGRGLRLAD